MEAKRILLIRPCALGDFVLTMPVLYVLEEHFPQAEITLVGNPQHKDLASGLLDSALDYSSAQFTSLFSDPDESLRGWLAQFDLALCYLPDEDGRLRANLRKAGIRTVVVHNPRREGGGHFADELMLALREIGIAPPPAMEIAKLRYHASPAVCTPEKPVSVHPGSGSARKVWPAERFAELCDQIRAVLIEGPIDADVAARVRALARRPIETWRPPTLAALRDCLLRCSAFVGNDSGVTHLAAMLGLPTVAIFGPTDPRRWAPLGRRVHVLGGELPCTRGRSFDNVEVEDVLHGLRVVCLG